MSRASSSASAAVEIRSRRRPRSVPPSWVRSRSHVDQAGDSCVLHDALGLGGNRSSRAATSWRRLTGTRSSASGSASARSPRRSRAPRSTSMRALSSRNRGLPSARSISRRATACGTVAADAGSMTARALPWPRPRQVDRGQAETPFGRLRPRQGQDQHGLGPRRLGNSRRRLSWSASAQWTSSRMTRRRPTASQPRSSRRAPGAGRRRCRPDDRSARRRHRRRHRPVPGPARAARVPPPLVAVEATRRRCGQMARRARAGSASAGMPERAR